MIVTWKVWTDATTEVKTRRVLSRILERLRVPAELESIDAYPKIDGHVAAFTVQLQAERWPDLVLEGLQLGQRVGSGWCVSGSLTQDITASSNHVSVAGVVLLEWSLLRTGNAR